MSDLEPGLQPFARPGWIPTQLSTWGGEIDRLLEGGRPQEALPLIQVVLRHLPRHLLTYFRLLQATWLLRRWDEGRDWALRLLRADPCNELAWSVLACDAEAAGELALARQHWTRALEQAPYHPSIRKGISRVTLGRGRAVTLNRPALATLYRMGERWTRAAILYRELLEEDPDRLDFQCGLLESLWRSQQTDEALRLARYMVQREPNLLLGWTICDALGDDDDNALALAPRVALDPDGEYAALRFWLTEKSGSHVIAVAPGDAALIRASVSPKGENP